MVCFYVVYYFQKNTRKSVIFNFTRKNEHDKYPNLEYSVNL